MGARPEAARASALAHPHPALLMAGGDRRVLAGHLWRLCQEGGELRVILLTNDGGQGPELREEILRTWLHFQQMQRPGAEPRVPIFLECASFEGEAHAVAFQGLAQVQVVPDQAQLSAEEAGQFDMSLSEAQGDLLTYLEGLGLVMDHEGLLACLQTPPRPMLGVGEAFALVRAHSEQWMSLDATACERAWKGPLGATFRALDAMGLWRSRLMSQHADLLERAIRRLHAEPGHAGARLVLLLHKRVYRNDDMAPWVAEVQRRHLETAGQHLTLLPPLQRTTVTILTITYNRLPLLQRAVSQVLAQTDGDWKLFICDHGCTDGTTRFLAELQKAHPDQVRILRKEKNLGPEAVGPIHQDMLAQVDTDLVLTVSDDDWLLPDHLAKTLGHLRAHPWAAMATAAYAGVRPDGSVEFQYGPWYPTTQAADPQVELQRALYAGVCPQGCVLRKDLLKEFVAEDPFAVGDCYAYASWDYLLATKLLARFEVGFVAEVLTAITIAPNTAFAGRDFSFEFLKLLEGLCADYTALFGPASFPAGLLQQFLQNIVLPMIGRNFMQILVATPNTETLDAALTPKRKVWEQFIATNQRIHAHTSLSAPNLVAQEVRP